MAKDDDSGDPEGKGGQFSVSEVEAGQAVYSRRVLKAYDLLVLGLSNRLIWRCPTPGLLDLYNRHVGADHLDVGVGTGYFPDRCRPPEGARVALLDLNANSLAAASGRISRYRPETYRANVLAPLEIDAAPFSSVAMNYLLHCLPGSIGEKAVAFDHVDPLLLPGGVIFGATLLGGGVRRGMLARRLMAFYNRKGIFSNTADDLEGLERALADRYPEWGVEVVGCGALFWGVKAGGSSSH